MDELAKKEMKAILRRALIAFIAGFVLMLIGYYIFK
jgi:hypothetical protein